MTLSVWLVGVLWWSWKYFFSILWGRIAIQKWSQIFRPTKTPKVIFCAKMRRRTKMTKIGCWIQHPPENCPPWGLICPFFLSEGTISASEPPPQKKGYLKTIQSCPVLNFQPNRSNIEEVRAISISKKCWSTRSTFRGKNRAFKSKYRYYRQRVRAARISILSFCMEKMHKVPMIILVKFGPPGTTILGVMKDLVWSFFSLFSTYLIFLLFFFRRKNALSKEWPISRVGFFGQKNDPTWWSNFSKNPASIFLKIDQGVPRNHMKA